MRTIRSVAPQFSASDATQIASSFYGLSEFIRELPSERDQNFLFTGSDSRLFILKIANSSEERDVLDFQNRAMAHMGNGVGVLASINGNVIENAQGHFVRLVHFVPGVPLAEFRPHSPALLRNLGRLLGHTDNK